MATNQFMEAQGDTVAANMSAPPVDSSLRPVIQLPDEATVRWGAKLGEGLYARFGKRSLDIIISVVVLLLFTPFLILVALAICLDSPGPALFRQTRVGRNGHPFTIYKFRTMLNTPRHQIKWSVDVNGNIRHKVRNDPRITRIGKWLRRLSLDEIPQLINVIKGDMSLVGPRPELVEIVQHYEEWQHERHLVRPGLTGWWQVSGRSDCPMHENTDLDLYYVRGQSLKLDCLIALKTVCVVIRGLGAF